MSKILSIIIPTYNMEKYLNKCLDSLLISENQHFIEVLVINDGSKDSSLRIAQTYEQKYPNIFKVIDKENGNYGSCVNVGIRVATGKYVKILDADDCFDSISLEKFVKLLVSVDVDLFITNYRQVDENCTTKRLISYNIPSNQIISFDNICSTKEFAHSVAMHAVTYKRENLLNIGYKQTEGISYTDEEWIFCPMSTVKTAYYYDIYLYNYLIGRPGQTVNPEIAIRNIGHTIIGLKTMLSSKINLNGLSRPVGDYLDYRLNKRTCGIYRSFLLENNQLDLHDLLELDNYIKNINPNLYLKSEYDCVHRFIPYRYIFNWRKKKYMKKKFFVYTYEIMKKIHHIIVH